MGILSAPRHRARSGEGQHVELALVDSRVAWRSNAGMNGLISGRMPPRCGNAHPNIAPARSMRSRMAM
ncbi:CoA transferase [Paracoccus sp. P2]|uniref:CoA transferase n=1 Tax=Paracoccus TaxID=265 RepID=UPI000463AA22|nr:CoA transferase [Paracoccus pantotrophus]MDF3854498.1 CoA transferase [Paracoccus pantotrophus]